MTVNTSKSSHEDPVDWLKDIWNIKTSPKIKDFLWRIAKRAIPVSANLERRGFPSFNCKKCGAHENDLHVFLNCPIAEEVWSLIPTVLQPTSQILSATELIKHGKYLVLLPPTGLIAPLWPWVVWNLWKARNKLVFENRVFSAQEIVLKSIKDAKEWSEAQLVCKQPLSSLSPHASSPRSLCPRLLPSRQQYLCVKWMQLGMQAQGTVV